MWPTHAASFLGGLILLTLAELCRAGCRLVFHPLVHNVLNMHLLPFYFTEKPQDDKVDHLLYKPMPETKTEAKAEPPKGKPNLPATCINLMFSVKLNVLCTW